MHFHGGQQTCDGWLVDDLLVELADDGVAEYRHLSEHFLIAAAGVEFHDEVATLGTQIGGVTIRHEVQSEVVRMEEVLLGGDVEVA